ncbi:hypothetical protein BMS3Bbin11_00622 [bacterium BMS3Bbin11]|nr:hypothetical protein BMS3Bbin11_00622 [bacterium BMS3Bbin11]
MVAYSSSTGKYQASLHIPIKFVFLGEYKSYKEAEMEKKQLLETNVVYVKTKQCQHFDAFSHDFSLNAL